MTNKSQITYIPELAILVQISDGFLFLRAVNLVLNPML